VVHFVVHSALILHPLPTHSTRHQHYRHSPAAGIPGDPRSPQEQTLNLRRLDSPKKPKPEAPDWLELRVIQFTLLTTIVMGTILMHLILWEDSYAQDELQLIGTDIDNSTSFESINL
jgi:hypothetical protein